MTEHSKGIGYAGNPDFPMAVSWELMGLLGLMSRKKRMTESDLNTIGWHVDTCHRSTFKPRFFELADHIRAVADGEVSIKELIKVTKQEEGRG